MPPYKWPFDPIEKIQEFETRHDDPAAAALFAWAAWTVDCLHYLDDIDLAIDLPHATPAGYNQDTIGIAHAC